MSRTRFLVRSRCIIVVTAALVSVIAATLTETGHVEGKRASRYRNYSSIKRDSYTDAAASAGLGTVTNGGGTGSGSVYNEYSYSPSESGTLRGSDYSAGNQGQYGAPASSSYGVASGGYGAPMNSQGSSLKYHYQIRPHKETTNNGWGVGSYDDYDDEDKEDKLKGLLGLIGLTGLAGLKPLKLLGILALPFAPILVPLGILLGGLVLASPLILILLAILFIPLPSLYFPPGTLNPNNGVLVVGRSKIANATLFNETTSRAIDFSNAGVMSRIFKAISTEYSKTAESTIATTECLERVSCELSKFTRSYNPMIVNIVLSSVRKIFGENGDRYMKKVNLGMSQLGHKCNKFRCDSLPMLAKVSRVKTS